MPLITLLIYFTTSQKGHGYSIRIYLSLKTISMPFGFDTLSNVSSHSFFFFLTLFKSNQFLIFLHVGKIMVISHVK